MTSDTPLDGRVGAWDVGRLDFGGPDDRFGWFEGSRNSVSIAAGEKVAYDSPERDEARLSDIR